MGEGDGVEHAQTQSTWGTNNWPHVEAVYRAHVVAIWRFIHQRLHGDRDAADEITSQVFLAMLEQADRFDPARGASVESWLFGIARHKLADHLRGIYRERKHRRAWQALRPSLTFTPPEADADAETRAHLHAALARLPANERDALLWKYHDRLSTRRIADRLGRSEKACENLLYRARQRFRTLYTRLTEGQHHEARQ